MDRKRLTWIGALCSILFSLPAFSATQFPFTVVRDANGKLEKIELPKRMAMADSPDMLALLREAVSNKGFAATADKALSTDSPTDPDERAAWEEAKALLAKNFSKSDVEDPRLDSEYAKAKKKLEDLFSYRLLASPYQANAFDAQNVTAEAFDVIMEGAKQVLDIPSVFSVFEFLIDQHIDALENRRNFNQNRLLALLDQTSGFTEGERALVRSSVYYSRLLVVDLPHRDSARKNWSTYGNTEWAKEQKKCDGFVSKGDRSYGRCFKLVGHELRNRLTNYNVLSKSTSLTYDFDKPNRVRTTRIAWIMSKLALKFVPAPGIVKAAVGKWISSHYKQQRHSDGFAYESARQKGEDNLAAWIAVGTVNPILNP